MGITFCLIYLVLRTVFSTSTVYYSIHETPDNPSMYFISISVGYLIGAGISPNLFKALND